MTIDLRGTLWTLMFIFLGAAVGLLVGALVGAVAGWCGADCRSWPAGIGMLLGGIGLPLLIRGLNPNQ